MAPAPTAASPTSTVAPAGRRSAGPSAARRRPAGAPGAGASAARGICVARPPRAPSTARRSRRGPSGYNSGTGPPAPFGPRPHHRPTSLYTARTENPMRKFASIAAFALSALATVALAQDKPTPPSKPAEPGKKLVVGFSQVGAESSWRTAETKSIKDEAQKRGVDLRFSDAQGKQSAQVRAIKSFVTQKVDVIVLAPAVETGWDAALKEAKAANIPVILVDRGIKTTDDSLYATLIASDFVEEGRM